MVDPHPETAAQLAALAARMDAAERERSNMAEMLAEIRADLKALRTTTDRGAGSLSILAWLGGSGGMIGMLAAAWSVFHK